MMTVMRWIAVVLLIPSALWADECPDAPDHSIELSALFDEARSAPNEREARGLSEKMWALWLDAPDEAAQEVLDRGMQQRASYDYTGAHATFTTLIAYCPMYAEGYNQRAFVHFLTGNHDEALTDLEQALALSPNHVGAQSGRALTLMHQGKIPEARAQMLEALANNPWLSERALIGEGAPLGPQGQKL